MENIYQLYFLKSIGIGMVLAVGCMFYMIFVQMNKRKAFTAKERIAYRVLSAVIIIGGLSIIAEMTSFDSKVTATVWFVPVPLIWCIAILLYAYLILTATMRHAMREKAPKTEDLPKSFGNEKSRFFLR